MKLGLKVLSLLTAAIALCGNVAAFVSRDGSDSRGSRWRSQVTNAWLKTTRNPLSTGHSAANVDSWKSAGVAVSDLKRESQKAGTDGYSVMRQPLSQTNWDPNASPENEVPSSLKDDDSISGISSWKDEQWWLTGNFKRETAKPRSDTDQSDMAQSKKKRGKHEWEEEPYLDLFQRTFETLDYPRILRALSDEHVMTVPARNILNDRQPTPQRNYRSDAAGASRAFQPFLANTAIEAKERYRAVEEMQWILEGRTDTEVNLMQGGYFYRNQKGYKEQLIGGTTPVTGHSFALEPILEAASTVGLVLESPQLLEISSALGRLQDIKAWGEALAKVSEVEFVEIPKFADCIQVNQTLKELLSNALDKEGRLSATTFPTIGRMRAQVRALRSEILQTLDSLVQMPSIQAKLALESGGPLVSEVNGGRLVIPLQASDSKRQASSVGIVHDTSRSGKTVYVEPTEIVGPTNELRQLEGELRSEEARVWRYLTQQVLVNKRSIEISIYAAGQLDLVQARLMLGRSWEGLIPKVGEEGVICLRDAKHPVLLLRNLDNIVGSDIDLGANGNQGLVLTGPNSGGKTVILKLLGLVALLARGGVPVPASPGDDSYQPRVDFFDPVLADIGDIQSVGGDLSTFSGHMLVCKQVLENAGENALVLMDELGSGTDPAQGVAIAQALLEAILEKGTRAVITTHYMQLKQLAASDDRFAVAGMQFVNGRPTYKLLPGTVGESFALAVAERLELPPSVLLRANELLDADTRQMGDLIRELEDQKALLDAQIEEMEEKRREMAKMEFEIKERQVKLEKKQLNVRREEARKFAQKLEEKEQILEDILSKLKSDPSRKIVAKSWDDIKFVKRDALNEAENVPSVLARKKEEAAAIEEVSAELVPIADLGDDKPELQENDAVVVCKKGPLFAREGTVVKVLGNRVEVKVNNMNVSFKMTEIALPPKNGVHLEQSKQQQHGQLKGKSRAVERALEQEKQEARNSKRTDDFEIGVSSFPSGTPSGPGKGDVTIRTDSNTVDVRGCNLMEAQEKVKDKCSMVLMNGRSKNPVVYILHGHGTGGVLKTKIRQWAKTERGLIKKWSPADAADGGDAFTRIELK
ncbi:hypothetical protein ACA910_022016 [Epithemia clementina (nom. ined.)]